MFVYLSSTYLVNDLVLSEKFPQIFPHLQEVRLNFRSANAFGLHRLSEASVTEPHEDVQNVNSAH